MIRVSHSAKRARAPRRRPLTLCAWLTALVLVLGGCGGSKHAAGGTAASVATDPGSEPNAVIVRVAGHAITKAQFAHALAGRIKFEQLQGFVPVPPRFSACIAHLEASSGGAKASGVALRAQCEGQYRELLKGALGPLISERWVMGAAGEAGVSVSQGEVGAQVKREEGHSTRAQVVAELAKRDETLAEFALEVEVDMLAEKDPGCVEGQGRASDGGSGSGLLSGA